jgi:lysozyme
MPSKQASVKYLALLVLFALVLTACVRPLRNEEEATPEATAAETVEPTEEVAAETPPAVEETESAGEVAEGTAAVEPEAAEPTAVEPTAEPTEEEPTAAPPTVEPTATPEPTATAEAAEAESTTVSEEAAAEPTQTATASATAAATATATATPAPTAQPLPATHTVAAGENLYRIGLKYGISWVTLAAYNNLPNANYVYVGQVLNIPPASSGPQPGQPTQTPTPGTYYTVQPGDNLYRIGLSFGVSWEQIAEANGIVNPNQIYAGQVLKIPSSAPGPNPQFTHVVKPGESLYSISLLYGVSWLTIAQANNIVSPYVIYAGQTLVIPGG